MMNKIADTLVSAGLLGKEPVITQSDSLELRDFMGVSAGERLEILNASEQLITTAESIVAQTPLSFDPDQHTRAA